MSEHNQHTINHDTGQAECECCCGWALDMERDRKAHRKREEELLGMLQLLVDAIELIPGGAVMKRITNEARALLDGAKEEKQHAS